MNYIKILKGSRFVLLNEIIWLIKAGQNRKRATQIYRFKIANFTLEIKSAVSMYLQTIMKHEFRNRIVWHLSKVLSNTLTTGRTSTKETYGNAFKKHYWVVFITAMWDCSTIWLHHYVKVSVLPIQGEIRRGFLALLSVYNVTVVSSANIIPHTFSNLFRPADDMQDNFDTFVLKEVVRVNRCVCSSNPRFMPHLRMVFRKIRLEFLTDWKNKII